MIHEGRIVIPTATAVASRKVDVPHFVHVQQSEPSYVRPTVLVILQIDSVQILMPK